VAFEVKVSTRPFEGVTVRRASRDLLLRLGYQMEAQMVERREVANPGSSLLNEIHNNTPQVVVIPTRCRARYDLDRTHHR
jgi:hypothetical protein